MARTRSGKDKRSYPQAPLYVSEIPSEVPLGERAARAGLQVPLESSGVGFIGEPSVTMTDHGRWFLV